MGFEAILRFEFTNAVSHPIVNMLGPSGYDICAFHQIKKVSKNTDQSVDGDAQQWNFAFTFYQTESAGYKKFICVSLAALVQRSE